MPTEWLDKTPLPAGVIRNERFVYANEALADLLGLPRERVVGMRFTDPVVREDRERLHERHARRLRGEPVPDSYMFTIERADGQRRVVEIFVSRVPATGDVLFQVFDRTDRVTRQASLAAVARLGAAVQREHSDEGIFRAVGAGLLALGIASARLVREGERAMRVAEVHVPDALLRAMDAAFGRSVHGVVGPSGPGIDAAWRENAAYIDDLPLAAVPFFGDVRGEAVRTAAAQYGMTRAVTLRIDVGGAPSSVLLLTADWLQPEDLPAFSLFATQVSAALDAARVIADLSRRNAQLAALNRVAAAAGASTDLGALFARTMQEVTAVLGCETAAVYLLEPDGRAASLAHMHGIDAGVAARYARLATDGPRLAAVVRDATTAVWHIAEFTPDDGREMARIGLALVVAVPLVSRSRVVGLMMLGYRDARVVGEPEIELLQAIGTHLAAAVATSRLVDDLRTSYAALSRAQQQLVQRERLAALGELAAAVAHEVRNPLGVIFNSIGSLRRLVPDAGDTRVLLEILSEEAGRLNHIVGDLLDFARPVTPAVRPEPLDAVVNDAVDAAVVETGARIEVVREYEPGLGPVPMDPRLVRQAVLNLAHNALQAMEGRGTLRVRIARDDAPADGGRGVRVEVIDSGGGIPPEVLPRIFEPFFTTRATGTGLGLAVVKRIIEGHGGTLTVTSEPGRGTTAAFRLPLDAHSTA